MELIRNALKETSENERVHTLFAVDIVAMTHAHIIYMTFKIFVESIEQPGAFKCPNLKENLRNLARMFALNELIT